MRYTRVGILPVLVVLLLLGLGCPGEVRGSGTVRGGIALGEETAPAITAVSDTIVEEVFPVSSAVPASSSASELLGKSHQKISYPVIDHPPQSKDPVPSAPPLLGTFSRTLSRTYSRVRSFKWPSFGRQTPSAPPIDMMGSKIEARTSPPILATTPTTGKVQADGNRRKPFGSAGRPLGAMGASAGVSSSGRSGGDAASSGGSAPGSGPGAGAANPPKTNQILNFGTNSPDRPHVLGTASFVTGAGTGMLLSSPSVLNTINERWSRAMLLGTPDRINLIVNHYISGTRDRPSSGQKEQDERQDEWFSHLNCFLIVPNHSASTSGTGSRSGSRPVQTQNSPVSLLPAQGPICLRPGAIVASPDRNA
ncbi:hypothetical protein BCV70DRAFT_232432 [Testicularia cyperi]|uniref:Uncharacterized protein n=1 Tax=Testicularia cyperi TaxID=1882483 RepID=A0A317XMH8_9BASI|nr:hypothetical protein BCV70DRAFT_232432 [Testicularia cyperi]